MTKTEIILIREGVLESWMHDEHDPELHPADTTDWTPSTLTQSLIGGGIMFTIALAFYGAAMILAELQTTFMGLR